MIEFLLNDQPVALEHAAPSLSVLQYLRTEVVQTGTKEGCAAGDCGACTVVIGELRDDKLHYRAVNACITPIGSLHGKQLLTVEHLKQGEQLHPVQQAMVNCHGAQCGFCTPGIVMSLYAWWLGVHAGTCGTDRHSVEIALSGNLCRCTGYQPILEAAQQSLSLPGGEQTPARIQHLKTELKRIANGPSGSIQSGDTRFFVPVSIAELARLLQAYPAAKIVAGATDIGLEFTQQLKQPTVLIHTGHVQELSQIDDQDDMLVIGAGATFSSMQPYLQTHFPDFAKLLDRLGSLQIRNQGTLGGNIANASPIGDSPPVLLALDAQLVLTSSQGSRQVPLSTFFTGYRSTLLQPGEFIQAIHIPKLKPEETLKVYKISKRFDDDISAVCMAIWLQHSGDIVTGVRIGCGGMAATPARAVHTEQALAGKVFDQATIQVAQQALHQDFQPIDDIRATAAYRLAVAGNLLTRAQLELTGQDNISLFAAKTGGTTHVV